MQQNTNSSPRNNDQQLLIHSSRRSVASSGNNGFGLLLSDEQSTSTTGQSPFYRQFKARLFDPKKYESLHQQMALSKYGDPKVKTIEKFMQDSHHKMRTN